MALELTRSRPTAVRCTPRWSNTLAAAAPCVAWRSSRDSHRAFHTSFPAILSTKVPVPCVRIGYGANRPAAQGASLRQLGELETRIMHVLWRRGRPATVKDVQVHLAPKRELAYTTVMTVMDRLWRKGLLHRERRGRPFHYTPAVSEAEYTAGVMRRVLGSSRDRKGVLA